MPDNFSKWGWKENPFVLKIDPNLFVGYEKQVHAALKHIENKHKVAVITGRTGAGKTTFLKWVESNYNDSKLYVSKPPQKPEEFVSLFTDLFGFSFWEKLMRRKPSLYNLPDYINRKLKNQHLVFLLDETHETNKEVLEWLRVLTDQIDNISLVIAGMPALDEKMSDLETLKQRITTRISLVSLDKNETRELIKKRIENAGGRGILPFTEDSIDLIYKRTGGFPREILKLCDRLVNSALERNLDAITRKDIEEHKEIDMPKVRVEEPVVTFMPKPPSEEQFRNLPSKQRKILKLLSDRDWLTPTAIVEELEMKSSYKSKGHAIRSVNNILRRLMLDGYVQREGRGKAFMYALTPKTKTLFVEN